MAFTFINKTTADATNNGTVDSITTAAVNMTGANTLIVIVAMDAGCGSVTITDSSSNTWEEVVRESGIVVHSGIYLAKNATVSSTQTFTVDATSSGYFSCVVYGFSGGHASSIIDQTNGEYQNTVESIQPGSVTPSQNNELLVAGVANALEDTITVNSGFSSVDQELAVGSSHFGCAAAYKIQTSLGAENPTFSWTGNASTAATIATFKADVTLGRLILRTPA